MEAMSPTPLGEQRLLELGGARGADVPFLVTGASRAWAWGRGDRLLLLPPLRAVPVMLYTFADGVNTGAAYGALAAQRVALGEHVTTRVYDVESFSTWELVAELAENDFERVVPSLHDGVRVTLPLVKEHVASFRESHAPTIGLLSGSGATCFHAFLGHQPRDGDGNAVEIQWSADGPFTTMLTQTL
jgi:4-diphosphocytidyl-2-C-methyl-D-erythritol kinase